MISKLRYTLRTSAALAAIGLAACGSSSTAPAGKTGVTLSFAGVRPAALAGAALNGQVAANLAGIVVGSDILIITEAKLVLRKIELKRSNATPLKVPRTRMLMLANSGFATLNAASGASSPGL